MADAAAAETEEQYAEGEGEEYYDEEEEQYPDVPVDAQYDNVPTLAKALDLHLMFPLVQFLEDRQVYAERELMKAKLEMLEATHMVDYMGDVHKQFHGTDEVPQRFKEKHEKVVDYLTFLETKAKPAVDLFDDKAKVAVLNADGAVTDANLGRLGVAVENIEKLYEYAKAVYNAGNYEDSAQLLAKYRRLDPHSDRGYNALWGKLAAEILNMNWPAAKSDLYQLAHLLEEKPDQGDLVKLQGRTWLLHWSLFVFFNSEVDCGELVDFFMQKPMLRTIQATCPHLLRYVAAATVIKNKKPVMRDVCRVLQQESQYAYRDPVTDFLECLYVRYDFEGAQKALKGCERLLATDFFLVFFLEGEGGFLNNARKLMFELYAKIHNKINIKKIGDAMGITDYAEAERWVVTMIRDAGLDAKINESTGEVVLQRDRGQSKYADLVKQTEQIRFRTDILVGACMRHAAEGTI